MKEGGLVCALASWIGQVYLQEWVGLFKSVCLGLLSDATEKSFHLSARYHEFDLDDPASLGWEC